MSSPRPGNSNGKRAFLNQRRNRILRAIPDRRKPDNGAVEVCRRSLKKS
jgi:hypothetical protein